MSFTEGGREGERGRAGRRGREGGGMRKGSRHAHNNKLTFWFLYCISWAELPVLRPRPGGDDGGIEVGVLGRLYHVSQTQVAKTSQGGGATGLLTEGRKRNMLLSLSLFFPPSSLPLSPPFPLSLLSSSPVSTRRGRGKLCHLVITAHS